MQIALYSVQSPLLTDILALEYTHRNYISLGEVLEVKFLWNPCIL